MRATDYFGARCKDRFTTLSNPSLTLLRTVQDVTVRKTFESGAVAGSPLSIRMRVSVTRADSPTLACTKSGPERNVATVKETAGFA